jgi:hypothetical protein
MRSILLAIALIALLIPAKLSATQKTAKSSTTKCSDAMNQYNNAVFTVKPIKLALDASPRSASSKTKTLDAMCYLYCSFTHAYYPCSQFTQLCHPTLPPRQ